MRKILAIIGTLAAIVIMAASFMAPAFANPSHQVGANFHVALLTVPVHRADPPQICNDDANGKCLNWWNAPMGNLVKSYSANVANDAMALVQGPNSTWTILVDGPTGSVCDPIQTQCLIGDNNNDKFDAKAGVLEPGAGGWGTVFTMPNAGCPGGEFVLKNNHWQGYIYAGQNNGDQVYLNNAHSVCLSESTFLGLARPGHSRPPHYARDKRAGSLAASDDPGTPGG